MRSVLCVLLLFASAAPLCGQQASVASYGTPCPPGTAVLTTQGLPRLGATFVVTGVSPLQGCTLRACFCECCLCNSCFGPSLLILGATRVQTPLVLPGLGGSGCPLLASPHLVLLPDSFRGVSLTIPNLPALAGVSFYLQRLDTGWMTTRGSRCSHVTDVLTSFALSDGVRATIGF